MNISNNKQAGHFGGEGVYGLGFIGALIYYLQHSTTIWTAVLGILKSLVWPAMLAYKLLEYLKM